MIRKAKLIFFTFNDARNYELKTARNLPVMIGGSTTVDGPKNDGMSPDVVTGVLRSPVCWCWTCRSAVCWCDSCIFNVGWLWCPLGDDVVVVTADDDTTDESDFDWVTEVAECELVLLLFDVFTVFACCCWCWVCWIADCCICCDCWWWWWWLFNNCVCWCEWWLLFAVAWLLLFKLYEPAVVAAVLNRLHVSKLSTLKCAAAADSVNR